MRGYKLALFKAYFDEGYGFTSVLKYALAVVFGVDAIIKSDMQLLLIVGFSYAISCFLIGWLIFKTRFKDAMIEVGNRFNPFVAEMRQTIGIPKNRKV